MTVNTQVFQLLFACALLLGADAFQGIGMRRTSVKPPSMVLDGLAELAVAAKLSASSPLSLNSMNTLPIAKTVTKEGMYGSYTVDIVDDSKLDQVKRSYKTAEETEDSKGKYWVVLGVLLFGSFTIPMIQYYWYVADDD